MLVLVVQLDALVSIMYIPEKQLTTISRKEQ